MPSGFLLRWQLGDDFLRLLWVCADRKARRGRGIEPEDGLVIQEDVPLVDAVSDCVNLRSFYYQEFLHRVLWVLYEGITERLHGGLKNMALSEDRVDALDGTDLEVHTETPQLRRVGFFRPARQMEGLAVATSLLAVASAGLDAIPVHGLCVDLGSSGGDVRESVVDRAGGSSGPPVVGGGPALSYAGALGV